MCFTVLIVVDSVMASLIFVKSLNVLIGDTKDGVYMNWLMTLGC